MWDDRRLEKKLSNLPIEPPKADLVWRIQSALHLAQRRQRRWRMAQLIASILAGLGLIESVFLRWQYTQDVFPGTALHSLTEWFQTLEPISWNSIEMLGLGILDLPGQLLSSSPIVLLVGGFFTLGLSYFALKAFMNESVSRKVVIP